MNRIVLLGVAMFFAIVGIALMGSDNTAVAGHGGHGCNGASCDGGCGGYDAGECCGRRHHRHRRCDGGGCRGRHHHRRNRCCGEVNACCGEAAPACCAVAAGPMQAPGKGDYGPAQAPGKGDFGPAQAPGKGAPEQAPAQAPEKGAPGQAPAQAPAK